MLTTLAAALGTVVSVAVSTPEPVGTLHVSICARDEFLTGRCTHSQNRPAAAEDVFVFDDVAPGEWAVQVWRDPESDGRMRTMMFGIPAEPVAISRNPPARFGPPRFADARLQIGAEPVSVSLQVR